MGKDGDPSNADEMDVDVDPLTLKDDKGKSKHRNVGSSS